MLSSHRLLVADAIPLIDLLESHLKNMLSDLNLPQIIRASAAKGRAVLNKYYSKTDDSKMYRLCMSKFSFTVSGLALYLPVISAPSKVQDGILHQGSVGDGMD